MNYIQPVGIPRNPFLLPLTATVYRRGTGPSDHRLSSPGLRAQYVGSWGRSGKVAAGLFKL